MRLRCYLVQMREASKFSTYDVSELLKVGVELHQIRVLSCIAGSWLIPYTRQQFGQDVHKHDTIRNIKNTLKMCRWRKQNFLHIAQATT